MWRLLDNRRLLGHLRKQADLREERGFLICYHILNLCRLRAVSLFLLVRREKRARHENDHSPLTKSEENERLLANYNL